MSCSLHDLAEYENQGIPAVLVASSEFEAAVERQKDSLGTVPTVVYVPHPIQSRTDIELEALAESILDEVLSSLAEA